MSSAPAPSDRVEEKLSVPLFVVTVALSLGGLLGLVWWLAPGWVWEAQWSAAWWAFAAVFLIVKMGNCFLEFFFHRYVLHKPAIPGLGRFYRQHTLHHALTRIGRRRTQGGREVPVVENIYPMLTPEQDEASFFPWYTLAVFGVLTAPVFALLQWLVPDWPWFVGGYAALAASLVIYEMFHAVEHWPFERWAKVIELPRTGWAWRKIYSFHLRHHAVIDCNEAISGFFTVPVADFVFGTWIFPKSLYVDGGEWVESEFKSPRPVAPIRWLDGVVDRWAKARRKTHSG